MNTQTLYAYMQRGYMRKQASMRKAASAVVGGLIGAGAGGMMDDVTAMEGGAHGAGIASGIVGGGLIGTSLGSRLAALLGASKNQQSIGSILGGLGGAGIGGYIGNSIAGKLMDAHDDTNEASKDLSAASLLQSISLTGGGAGLGGLLGAYAGDIVGGSGGATLGGILGALLGGASGYVGAKGIRRAHDEEKNQQNNPVTPVGYLPN